MLQNTSSLILRELASVGVHLRSVASRIPPEADLTIAAPILMRHLLLNYPEPIRESIVRTLSATKAALLYRDEFLRLFKQSSEASVDFRFALAHAVACSTKASNLQEIIDLLYEKQYGVARIGLLSALKKNRRRPEVVHALAQLRLDPELQREIDAWGKK
jgi:hypothetical protein